MTAGEAAALVAAVTAFITSLSTLLAQIGHIHWHASQGKPVEPAQQATPPEAGGPGQ